MSKSSAGGGTVSGIMRRSHSSQFIIRNNHNHTLNNIIAGVCTDRSEDGLDKRLSDCLKFCGGKYLDLFILEYVLPEEMILDNNNDTKNITTSNNNYYVNDQEEDNNNNDDNESVSTTTSSSSTSSSSSRSSSSTTFVDFE